MSNNDLMLRVNGNDVTISLTSLVCFMCIQSYLAFILYRLIICPVLLRFQEVKCSDEAVHHLLTTVVNRIHKCLAPTITGKQNNTSATDAVNGVSQKKP